MSDVGDVPADLPMHRGVSERAWRVTMGMPSA